jgi:hypothetical protein
MRPLTVLTLTLTILLGVMLVILEWQDSASPRPNVAGPPAASPLPSPSPSPAPSPSPSPPPAPGVVGPIVRTMLLPVPFTSQAPLANWHDPVHQDACEEASVLMAMRWVQGSPIAGPQEANQGIRRLWDFVVANYGDYLDLSTADTARLIRDFYSHEGVRVAYDFGVDAIVNELAHGNLVIVPADGRRLGNPNFSGGGPDRHMLVVRGYDPSTRSFITNDPGTRNGELYSYPEEVLIQAVRDYPTGNHAPITQLRRAMIVVPPAPS